ncbi:MAG: DUF58 domain-containing protein [Gammaproteobacteria bacterium]
MITSLRSLLVPMRRAGTPPGAGARPDASSVARVSLADLVRLAPQAKQLELWQTRRDVEDGGAHHTMFKGRGMEFAETRPYQPGDDIRHIDWRVTARSGRAHTKLFREERERPVLVWVDCRPHMQFATRGSFKSVMAARLAALVAWAAHAHGDRVGGNVISAALDYAQEPRRGRHNVLRLLRALEFACAPTNAELGPMTEAAEMSLASLRRTVRPGTIVFLIGDFHDLEAAVRDLVAQIGVHSDVTLCCLHDPLEAELPPAGIYPVSSPHGEVANLDTANTAWRAEYARRFQHRMQALRAATRRHRARFLSVGTTDDPLLALRAIAGTVPARAAG